MFTSTVFGLSKTELKEVCHEQEGKLTGDGCSFEAFQEDEESII